MLSHPPSKWWATPLVGTRGSSPILEAGGRQTTAGTRPGQGQGHQVTAAN